MKSPLEAPEKQIAEETSAKPEKPTAAVIDTSKKAKNFCKSWKVICANMSIRTRSIAPVKFRPKILEDSPKSARLESKCQRNTADSVYHNPITDGRRFCLGAGMEMWPRLFPRINRSESRSHCSCSGQRSKNKNICLALRAARFLHSRLRSSTPGLIRQR